MGHLSLGVCTMSGTHRSHLHLAVSRVSLFSSTARMESLRHTSLHFHSRRRVALANLVMIPSSQQSLSMRRAPSKHKRKVVHGLLATGCSSLPLAPMPQD